MENKRVYITILSDSLKKKLDVLKKLLSVAKVGRFLSENKEEYKPEILKMQNLIRSITDIGVQLESLEQQNKTKFNTFIRNKRHAINDFKQSNRVATSYYQNMSNQHREWQSHFLDQKK